MHAVIQVFVFFIALSFFLRPFSLKNFLLTAGIVAIPFRTDFTIVDSGVGGWVDGIIISVSDICMICLGLQTLFRGEFQIPFSSKITRGLLAFAVACALSFLNTTSQPCTFFQLVQLAQVGVLYFVVLINNIQTREDVDVAIRATLLSLLFQGALGCVQFASGKDFVLFSTGTVRDGIVFAGEGVMRAVGTRSGKPNAYGMLVASLLLFNLGVLRFYRVSSILRSLALMFGAFGLIFSFSRGSWLSVSAGLLVLFAYSIRGTEIRRFKFVGACVAAVMIIGVFVFPLVRERLTQDDNNAAESRIPLMSIAFQMIKAHPVLGIGGNTYHFEMKNYIPKDFEQVYVDQVHNHYLLVFAETGLLGLLCWLVFVKSIVREALSCLKTITSDVTKGVGLGLLLVMVQISVHCMVETFASTMTLATLLSLAAIATAAHRVGLLDKAQDTDVQQVDSPVNAAAEFA